MAGDYMYPEDTMPAAPTRFEKVIKTAIVLAVLCIGAELVWLVGISPFRQFSRIDISGYGEIDRTELLAKAGIDRTSSYFSTDARTVERALMGISSLKSVRVFKHFPDKLQILLEGRQAVASALASIGGRIVPVLFDGQGVIFEIGGDGKEGSSHSMSSDPLLSDQARQQVPIISGFVIENPFPGMRLPSAFVPLFEELEKIQLSAPELLGAVSEIRINRKPFDSYDIVLYPMHKKVKVRLSELNEDLIRYTLLMVDVLASKEPGIEDLDFRAGIASYIPKEASSE